MTVSPPRVELLGLPVASCRFLDATEVLIPAGLERRGGSAFFCNVHMAIEARELPALRRAIRTATWVMPDGRPLSIALRLLGHRRSDQIAGPHMTEHLIAVAADRGLKIYLYGGTNEQLAGMRSTIAERYPGAEIVGATSPPFQPLGQEDLEREAADVAAIEATGAHLCFVGLGCPKQELWIQRNTGATGAVLLGVGAAFPMIAGTTPRAPAWMVATCTEWLYRLLQEPKRLWRRYAKSNPRFLNLVVRQLWTR